jgi:thiamine biosynthesis lipoprotein
MLHRLEFRAMGSEILAVVDSESRPSLLTKVPEWFEEWEQVLSRFRYDSELTQLNQTRERNVHVSPTLWDVFLAAQKAEQITDGLVTPTLLDALAQAGYDRPFDELSLQTKLQPDSVRHTSPSLNEIIVNASERTIRLPAGMSLDFGGVAKGWAAYQSMKRLQAEGPALVDAGGDISVSGAMSDGNPWPVGIADPFHPEEEIETLFLGAGGVATSGKDRRRWNQNETLQHHIIDPSTHKPAETDLLTVTVIAPDVMKAEAAAKAAFILGSHDGLEWLEARPELAGLFILDNGQLVRTNTMVQFTR